MSEADYLRSIDTYWADKYFEEKEKMSIKKEKQAIKKIKKRSPPKGKGLK